MEQKSHLRNTTLLLFPSSNYYSFSLSLGSRKFVSHQMYIQDQFWYILSVPLMIEHWLVSCDLIVNLFVWGNLKGILHIPSQNSFYGMPKPLVNCVERISLIYHSMPNISVMSPDLNGICATFGHSLRMYASVFSFPLHNLHVEDISSLLMWCFILFFLGP